MGQQTVIGVFDNASEAQQAVQELLSSGFTNANVDISSVAQGTTSGSTDLSTGTHENESGISKFFKNLFGDDDNDADRYSKVASRSNSIVTVYAQTADEACDQPRSRGVRCWSPQSEIDRRGA